TMTGGTVTTEGRRAYGVWATSNAQVTLNDGVAIRTEDEYSQGVHALGAARVSMTGGSITTEGLAASAISALGDSTVTLNDQVARMTKRSNAGGITVVDGADVEMTGGSITTAGAMAHGASIMGMGSVQLKLSNVAIKTTGSDSAGLIVADNAMVD